MSFLGFRMETLKHARTAGVVGRGPVTGSYLSFVSCFSDRPTATRGSAGA
jgi:hypothetical protein